MLYYLRLFVSSWGPFRMFGSHLLLLGAGASVAALFVLWRLPRVWGHLPMDRGKSLVQGGEASRGKPTGAGLWLFLLTLPALLLFLPYAIPGVDRATSWAELWAFVRQATSWRSFVSQQWGVVACLCAAMFTGYLDDRATRPWGRFRKGMLDLVISVAAAGFLAGFGPVEIWYPFVKGSVVVPLWAYICLAAPVLWISINATNCTDGVDGLAGTLTTISLFSLAVFLYGVIGHEKMARYFLVPHNVEGARWAILCMSFAGATTGYLWYNAQPSQVLMGDAGSRMLGLLVGVAALATGNPFFILVVSPVALFNGFTGIFKIVVLKLLVRAGLDSGPVGGGRSCRLSRFLRSIRCPLHDRCRKDLGWSNAWVLMRFTLIQAAAVPLFFLLLVKIR